MNYWSYREERKTKGYFKRLNLELGQEPHPREREATWTRDLLGSQGPKWKILEMPVVLVIYGRSLFQYFLIVQRTCYLIQEVIERAHLLVCMLFPLKTRDRGKGKADMCFLVAECRELSGTLWTLFLSCLHFTDKGVEIFLIKLINFLYFITFKSVLF